METQHLTYFKIENFKRFDSFEMSNLGQFNLIVGDNNVGKTSVLEALTFDEKIDRLAYNYWITFWTRSLERSTTDFSTRQLQQTHFWDSIFKGGKVMTFTLNNLTFWLELRPHQQLNNEEKDVVNKSVVISIPDYWLKLSKIGNDTLPKDWEMTAAYFEGSSLIEYTDRFDLDSYVPFISANLAYSTELVDMYYQFGNIDRVIRKEIEKNLRLFIPKLEEIRPHKIGGSEVLGIILSDSNILFPLTYFGDGTVKYLRLLLQVLITKDRRLMIDEIGSGIHFTRLKSYWQTIIQLCAKYNVQLFATTHSLECQQAFIEALEDSETQHYKKDARNISILENKQGEVKAFTYDFEQFEYSLSIGVNTRGGQL